MSNPSQTQDADVDPEDMKYAAATGHRLNHCHDGADMFMKCAKQLEEISDRWRKAIVRGDRPAKVEHERQINRALSKVSADVSALLKEHIIDIPHTPRPVKATSEATSAPQSSGILTEPVEGPKPKPLYGPMPGSFVFRFDGARTREEFALINRMTMRVDCFLKATQIPDLKNTLVPFEPSLERLAKYERMGVWDFDVKNFYKTRQISEDMNIRAFYGALLRFCHSADVYKADIAHNYALTIIYGPNNVEVKGKYQDVKEKNFVTELISWTDKVFQFRKDEYLANLKKGGVPKWKEGLKVFQDPKEVPQKYHTTDFFRYRRTFYRDHCEYGDAQIDCLSEVYKFLDNHPIEDKRFDLDYNYLQKAKKKLKKNFGNLEKKFFSELYGLDMP